MIGREMMEVVKDSFVEFTTAHAMMGHFELLLDGRSGGEGCNLEVFGGYSEEVMDMAMDKHRSVLNGTPQFYYCKINMATSENLENLQEYSLLWSEQVQKRLKIGASYIYFPYLIDETFKELQLEDSLQYRSECCEKIRKCLFEKMNLKDCFSSLTIQTVMLLQIEDLTSYYQEKRSWMVDNLKYTSFPIVSGGKTCEKDEKSFEIVEMKTQEEMIQFWTCQSDAFCGVQEISEDLKEVLLKDSSEHSPDSNVKYSIVGIRQKLSNGKVEVVACGKLVLGKHVASINHVATREGHRNQGFATILMVSMIDIAKQLGYSKMVLEATDQGIGIYEKFGFKPCYDFYVFDIEHKH